MSNERAPDAARQAFGDVASKLAEITEPARAATVRINPRDEVR